MIDFVMNRFDSIETTYRGRSTNKNLGIFISSSYDATSYILLIWIWLNRHFETVATDVLSLYKKVTGEHLDLHVDRDEEDDE